jgi:hypothetical protein
MYIRRALAAALVAIILSGIPALADYSDSEYRGTINIANAGAAVSGVTVKLTTNTQAFIDSGILDASFNNVWFDSAAGAALAFMPKPGAISEWYFYYPYSLAATATTLSYLYMGGPDMSAPLYYLPGATGMTAADSATLEPGSDWTAEFDGYVVMPADNSGTPGKLLYKDACIWLGTMQDGVMAMVSNNAGSFAPLSAGTGFQDPGAIWTQEAYAYDDNVANAADVGSVPATSWSDYLVIEYNPPTGTMIAAVQFYAEYDAASWNQVDVDAYYGAAWHDVYEGTYANLTYELKWLPGAYTVQYLRLRFYNSNALAQTETDLLREVRIISSGVGRRVIFAPLASGEHTIGLEYVAPAVTLSVDGVAEATDNTVAGGALNNNGNAWTAVNAASTAYMGYLKTWQGATLRQHIEWENDTTFTDLSGNGNDATPSFPAASSDPDVTTTLTAMAPLTPAEAPGTSTDSGSSMAGGLPDEPDNLFGELDADMEDIPGVAVVNAILDAGDIPRALFWFLFVFAAIVVLCLLTYHLSKSLMAMSLVAGAGMLFASKVGIVPYWVTVPLVLIALAVLVKEKMSPL